MCKPNFTRRRGILFLGAQSTSRLSIFMLQLIRYLAGNREAAAFVSVEEEF